MKNMQLFVLIVLSCGTLYKKVLSETTSSEPNVSVSTTMEPVAETEPESTAESPVIPEIESTSEPEMLSEPETTAGSEVEPENEITAEPEIASEPEVTSEPEITSEPETPSEPEIASEPETTSQPETSYEPEIASEPETTAESVVEPENEITSEPEIASEPEITYEPEVTSEPQTSSEPEIASEPETTSETEIESEPETSSEPEIASEPEMTSEPEIVSKPEIVSEPETSSEPEITSGGEMTSEPEIASEPETASEPEIESEPETSSEPEIASEPEMTSEPEIVSEPETSSEPKIEPELESSFEPETAAESEISPESESTSEPEVDPENTAEPAAASESETTSEPETSNTAEPEIGPEPESATQATQTITMADRQPSTLEVLLPPCLLILVIMLGIMAISVHSRRESFKKKFVVWKNSFAKGPVSNNLTQNISVAPLKLQDLEKNDTFIKNIIFQMKPVNKSVPLLDAFDKEVLESMPKSQNTPSELLMIAIPALVSLALSPLLTLIFHGPFTEYLWPETKVLPDINDAIACFLAPAGLVYATSFGFAFQQVLNKSHEIMTKLTHEISMIDQIATFTVLLKTSSMASKLKIIEAIKAEAIFMVLQILDREPCSYKNTPKDDVKVKIWSVLDQLRQVKTEKNNHVDRMLCEKIMNHIMKLNSICSDRMGVLHGRIHPVKWAFLETLGFFSFTGVLLLDAQSYRMELVMSIITVFSISMLCFVVSDLDSPFSGFFRVDFVVLPEVIDRLENIYAEAQKGDMCLVFYPERKKKQ